jgi:hypothetical protein
MCHFWAITTQNSRISKVHGSICIATDGNKHFFQLAVCQYDKKFGISREQVSDTHLGNATMKF